MSLCNLFFLRSDYTQFQNGNIIQNCYIRTEILHYETKNQVEQKCFFLETESQEGEDGPEQRRRHQLVHVGKYPGTA